MISDVLFDAITDIRKDYLNGDPMWERAYAPHRADIELVLAAMQQLVERLDTPPATGSMLGSVVQVRIPPSGKQVACLDCFWIGLDGELSAQACPKCDGRVADYDSAEFTERLAARLTREGTQP